MNYRDLYENIFGSTPEYNSHDESGWLKVGMAVQYVLDHKIRHVIDIGAGRGRFVKMMSKAYGLVHVYPRDLDYFGDYDPTNFRKCDLTNPDHLYNLLDREYDLVLCTGVLEHIEEQHIDGILEVFSKIAPRAFISIANHEEVIAGKRLHLTNRNRVYWDQVILNYFEIERCIDNLYDDTLFIYELKTRYGNLR